MIEWFNKLNNSIKFIFCIILVMICLLLSKSSYAIPKGVNNDMNNTIYKNLIEDTDTNYEIKVYYPKFNNIELDAIIKNYVFEYIKKFKGSIQNISKAQTLKINYTLFYKDNYVNIFFDIENSLDKKDTSKSIVLDLMKKNESKITNIYDEKYLKDNIINLVEKKYNSRIVKTVLNTNVNNYDYEISKYNIKIYLDNYEQYDYDLEVLISLSEIQNNETKIDLNKKKIALTFDDGPSRDYTKEIIDTLTANESKGTFFMLGYKMKQNKDLVTYVYDADMEIGSHTYHHKNLVKLSKKTIENEINSVSILYNSITNDNIKYLRPPYGNYNNTIKNICPYPIITWSIDPKDWLNKDPVKIYNHIIKRVEDGSIILLHDVYPTTVEAVKMLVPQLKSMGYEIVTVSELSESQNVKLASGKIYRKIK